MKKTISNKSLHIVNFYKRRLTINKQIRYCNENDPYLEYLDGYINIYWINRTKPINRYKSIKDVRNDFSKDSNKCKICGGYIRLNSSYETCSSHCAKYVQWQDETFRKKVSDSARVSLTNKWKNENFREHTIESISKRNKQNWKDKTYREHMSNVLRNNINKFEVKIKAQLNSMLKKTKHLKELHFYWVEIINSDKIKIGITYDSKNRYKHMKYLYKNEPKIIVSSKPDVICNLEYEIKSKFCLRDEISTEYIDRTDLKKIIKFSKQYVKNAQRLPK